MCVWGGGGGQDEQMASSPSLFFFFCEINHPASIELLSDFYRVAAAGVLSSFYVLLKFREKKIRKITLG